MVASHWTNYVMLCYFIVIVLYTKQQYYALIVRNSLSRSIEIEIFSYFHTYLYRVMVLLLLRSSPHFYIGIESLIELKFAEIQ